MKITVSTPEDYIGERSKLMREALELIRLQQQSCKRYATKINCILNKIEKLEKQLGGAK